MPEPTRLSKFSRSIDGRVAIVTGAASGMGRATAYLFADEGAKVAVVDRTAEGVLAVVDAIRNAGRVAEGFVTDVSDPKAIIDLVAGVRAKLGPVDILINNAGIAMPSPIEGDDWQEAWDATFLVNVTAQAASSGRVSPT